MAHLRLSNTDDWKLKFDEQDIRGFQALNEAGEPTGRTVEDLILDTDAERVSTIVLDDGTEFPADDVSIGDGVVYLTGDYPVNTEGVRRSSDYEDFGRLERRSMDTGMTGDMAAGIPTGTADYSGSRPGLDAGDVLRESDDLGLSDRDDPTPGYSGDRPGLDPGDFGSAGRAAAGAAAGAGMAVRDALTPDSGRDDDDRTHHAATYGATGRDYAYYEPGYRYGREMAADTRYTGRDYTDVEADLRTGYRADNDSLWDDVKDAVRHGYQSVTGRR